MKCTKLSNMRLNKNLLILKQYVSTFFVYTIATTFFILSIYGCVQDDHTSGRSVFRYNEVESINSLDPIYTRNLSNINGCNQLYNGLVQQDDKMHIIPCIAKHWTISSDALTYTFTLRDDVYFHKSGLFGQDSTRRVTSKDFVYSLNRLVDPKWASPGSWIMANVDRLPNNGSYEPLNIIAVNDTTLQIQLHSPYTPFLSILAMKYCSVVPHEVVEHFGKDFRINPIGTGPFVFKYWKEDEKLVFLKNDNYFETDSTGRRYPYIDAVAISFIQDKQTVFLEFIKDKFDYMSGIDPAYMKEVLTPDGELNPKYGDRFNLISQPYLNTEYIGFNIKDTTNPFSDPKVRQAANYAIDKEKMIRYLRSNVGEPGIYGFIPTGLPGHLTDVTYEYNPEKAIEILKESRFYKDGEFPEVSIATTSEYVDLCNYIQNRLTRIGIPTKVDIYSPAIMKDMRSTSKLQCFRGSWVADYSDAENYLSLFYSKNFTPAGPNYFSWKNEEYDKLYELSLHETDEDKRIQLYSTMDSLMMSDPPMIVLYYDRILRFTNKRVKNFGANPTNLVDLKRVVIEN